MRFSPLDEIEPEDYYQAKEELAGIIHWYNPERLHSALNYMTPADYNSGDPE